jgi:hypothetical protein
VFGVAFLASTVGTWHRGGKPVRTLAILGGVAIVATALAAARYYADERVNTTLERKQQALIQLQEKFAKPEYKPSTVYAYKPNSYYGIELRERGTPLGALLVAPWSWPGKTFASATGIYGWLQWGPPQAYHLLIALAYLALLGSYGWGVWRSRSLDRAVESGLVVAFAALTVAISLYHSWAHDFQAQGRYLFPVAAMLAVGLHGVRGQLPAAARWAVIAAFALSFYSFVFIGLAVVPGSF